MYKLLTFSGYDSRTGPHLFPIEPDVERTIGHIKMARALPPEIEQYIRNAKRIPGKTQLLIDAMGAGEYYGCFPAGTLVQTDNGEVAIEDIRPGTMVLTHLNRYRPVRALLPQPADELCDLQIQGLPANIPALTATPNHELWVVLRDDFVTSKRKHIWSADTSIPLSVRRKAAMLELPFSWVPIADLRSGDMIAEPFPQEEDGNALGGKEWNTPEAAFLMGLYAAEGCISLRYDRGDGDEPSKAIFVTGAHETGTHERAKECAAAMGHALTVHNLAGNATKLELSYKAFAQLCADNIGTKATDKRLSQNILRMPIGWQKTFFEAYANGDGCVRGPGSGKHEGTLRCVSASAGLLRDFRLLLARQGIAASISGRHNTKATWYNSNPIYELMVSGSQVGGRGCSKSYIHPNGYILSSVKKTKTYGWHGEVYDLSVEEDTSYVASGVSVHNSNVNGDFFPEDSLRNKGAEYGYETFVHYAYPFRHHQNKNPDRAFGDKVTLAAYDSAMHRVLLVVTIDDVKCEDILGDIAKGSYPDVSMGCRVPWDRCSICQNKAKNRGEYCTHLRYQMNKILPDGRRVFAYNDKPKFFDISFVTIGAEKASHVLSKIAHSYNIPMTSSAEAGESFYAKLALAEKKADEDKHADIDKDVPSNPPANISGLTGEDRMRLRSFMDNAGDVKAMEPSIPNPVLDQMAKHPLHEIGGTLAAMGIDLKPHEFQRIVLVKQGAVALANELEKRRLVFDEMAANGPMPKWAMELSRSSLMDCNEKVAAIARPYMTSRSCYPEVLLPRLERMEKVADIEGFDRESQWYPMTDNEQRAASGVSGLAGASAALAVGFLAFKKIFPGLETSGSTPVRALAKFPWLLPILLGAGVGASVGFAHSTAPMPLNAHGTGRGLDGIGKSASSSAMAVLGAVPLAYIYAGIQQRRWLRGEKLNKFDRFVAQRPDLSAIGSAVVSPLVVRNAKRLLKHGSVMGDMALYAVGGGQKLMPVTLAGAAADLAIFKVIERLVRKKKKN